MSTLDLFLRVFVALQVGIVFLIVCVALFCMFWQEWVVPWREERRRKRQPLVVPMDWEIWTLAELRRQKAEEARLRMEEW